MYNQRYFKNPNTNVARSDALVPGASNIKVSSELAAR